MKSATLVRFDYDELRTLGWLEAEGLTKLYVLEPPWKRNALFVSCIPEGSYVCRRSRFNRGGYDAIEIAGVPGRDRVLFHIGNRIEDTDGCPLVGLEFGELSRPQTIPAPEIGVLSSKLALGLLLEWAGDETFRLEIRPAHR